MSYRNHAAGVIGALLLVGCASAPPQIQTVKVPVPVPCQAVEPPRPAMPTEALPLDVDLDPFVAAAAAEIELREGYEIKLRAELASCIKPIAAAP